MTAYSFQIEQRQLPGIHRHSYVAIDEANGAEIPLPSGGNGDQLCKYPEIEVYLAGLGARANLVHTKARGDTLYIDRENDAVVYTFNTAGGVVVKDIPRLHAGGVARKPPVP